MERGGDSGQASPVQVQSFSILVPLLKATGHNRQGAARRRNCTEILRHSHMREIGVVPKEEILLRGKIRDNHGLNGLGDLAGFRFLSKKCTDRGALSTVKPT